MATTPDPTELAEKARCLQCGISPGMEMPILIYLFCKIANVNPDPTELAEQARCLFCGLPPGIQGSVLIYLVSQITGGGAGSIVLTGSGSPVGVVTPVAVGQLYTDTTTPGLWLSNGLTNASWTQIA